MVQNKKKTSEVRGKKADTKVIKKTKVTQKGHTGVAMAGKKEAFLKTVARKSRVCSPSLRELGAFALGVIFMWCVSYVMVHYRLDRDFKMTQKRLSYLHFVIQKDYEEALMACGCAPDRPCPRLIEGIRRQHLHKPMPREAKKRIPFPEEEYISYAKPGNFILAGNVCKKLPKGLICPKDVYVFVNPVTSYSKEWYHRHWIGREILEEPDRRAWWFHRSGKADAQGRFVLTHLPNGVYYVGAEMCAKSAENPHDRKCTPLRLAAKVHVYQDQMKVSPEVVFKGEPVFQGGGCGCRGKKPAVPESPAQEEQPEPDVVDIPVE